MSAPDLLGLVPGAVHGQERAVMLVAAGSTWFNEPFYRTTIEQLMASGRARPQRLTFAELHDRLAVEVRASDRSQPAPAGVLLHTSRCGSTLLTKMLRHDRTRLVLSEPSPIGQAMRLHLDAPTDGEATALVFDLVALLERCALGRGQRSVLKLSSWQAVATRDLAEQLPETPFIFVHRPAHEVVASLVANPPSWAPAGDDTAATAHGHAGPDRGTLPDAILDDIDPGIDRVGFFASVWVALVRAALEAPADRIQFVDLRDLLADPVTELEQVAAHLALDHGFDPERAAGELTFYAKSMDPTERFDGAGRHHRPQLSDRDRAAVAAIVGDLPDRLAARGSSARAVPAGNVTSTRHG